VKNNFPKVCEQIKNLKTKRRSTRCETHCT